MLLGEKQDTEWPEKSLSSNSRLGAWFSSTGKALSGMKASLTSPERLAPQGPEARI